MLKINKFGACLIALFGLSACNDGGSHAPSASNSIQDQSIQWQGDWQADTHYQPNDIVYFQNQAYVKVQSTNIPEAPLQNNSWELLASSEQTNSTEATDNNNQQGVIDPTSEQGLIRPAGAQGEIGMTWKGPWVSGEIYLPNDAVSFNGQSHININTTTGLEDPADAAFWELLADKGATGIIGPQGPQGIQGATGPQGVAGAKGEQGALGPTGLAGATGTQGERGPVGVTGQTGPEGPAGRQGEIGIEWKGAWVSGETYSINDAVSFNGQSHININTTTGVEDPANAAFWELLADKGEAGITGPQGPQGIQGTTGPQGVAGAKGEQGALGPTGPQGIQGATGPKGVAGAKGEQGALGPTGPAGAIGMQGEIGPRGTTGAIGPQGPAGAQGNIGMTWKGPWISGENYSINDAVSFNGKSHINVQSTNGIEDPTNTNFWELLADKGAAGNVGPQGPQGIQGITGAPGVDGAVGPQGIQGVQGPTGADGTQGPQGLTGETGPAGQQGDKGLNWQGTWLSGVSYQEDDVVAYRKSSFIAISDTSGVEVPGNALYWQPVVQPSDGHDDAYDFIGFSSTSVQADVGYFGMNGACKQTFGDNSRMANTSDIFYSDQTSSFTATAWLDTTKSKVLGYANRDGLFDRIIGFNRNNYEIDLGNCSGWGSTSFEGLLIDGATYKFVTGNCEDSHPVACSIPRPTSRPEYRFAGLSSTQVAGTVGLRAIKNACKADFGSEARMATTREISKSQALTPTQQDGWVQATVYNLRDVYSNLTSTNSCSGWSLDEFGITVSDDTGKFSRQSCTNSAPVACATPF